MRTFCLLGLLIPSVAAFAKPGAFEVPDTSKPVARAVRIEGNLPLTGTLDDPRWEAAQPVSLPYEIQPGENTPAPQETTVRILYNTDYVYFGYDCRDTHPDAIRAHITDRDKLYDDDFAVILLDT